MCSKARVSGLALLAILAAAAPARAQYVDIQSFEVTPFYGARLGGAFVVQPDGSSQTTATLTNGASYGFSAGLRFDDFSIIEFRWMRSMSTLRFNDPFTPIGVSVGDVAVNQFYADFTREFVIPDVKGLRSFLTGSLGVTHVGAEQDGFARFSFGLGAGLKQFLGSRFAIRAEAQWLPVVVSPSVGGFACGTTSVGGCVVFLNGTIVQQFHVSVGPVVRF